MSNPTPPIMSAKSHPDRMTITRAGSTTRRITSDIATGPFWAEILLEGDRDGENTAMRAHLDPGVITHWHTHPLGQILYVLSGVGHAQREGGPVEEIRAGDSVWFTPGEKHWHGASPASPFSYISIQGVQNGTAAYWFEPVAAYGDPT